MAHDLERPLITVSCHDDLTTADLVGRFLLEGGETRWVDGPADARRAGGCDLLSRRGRRGAPGHNGGDPPARRPSPPAPHRPARDRPRRRAGVLPRRVVQPRIPERPQGPQGLDPPAHGGDRARLPTVGCGGEDRRATRPGSTTEPAAQLVRLANAIRRFETAGLREVASTRVLIAAARLFVEGVPLAAAARAAIAGPLTDDPVVGAGLREMIATYLADADGPERRTTRASPPNSRRSAPDVSPPTTAPANPRRGRARRRRVARGRRVRRRQRAHRCRRRPDREPGRHRRAASSRAAVRVRPLDRTAPDRDRR